jgi:oxygen-independent coproporphyrinogen-3 oxidase
VCPYCDFAVQTGGPAKRQGYLDTLRSEIDGWAARVADPAPGGAAAFSGDLPFDTVYLGGGTPSALQPQALDGIVSRLRRRLPLSRNVEITLEANPEDVSDDNLAAWRAIGVTRVSLGVQSFDDAALTLLGRAHTGVRATDAVERALAAGLDAVSLDLIYAVPGQSPARWEQTLRRAVDLQPQHISCYELTVHERTRFFRQRERGELVEVCDDDKAEQFFRTHGFLADAGYPAYEVSNFAAAPEHRSRHNVKYWDHTPYLGLGPSAHSFDGRRERWWNDRRLVDWQSAIDDAGGPAYEVEALAAPQLALEALALGLRTTRGVDLEYVERRCGIDLAAANRELIDRLQRDRLLTRAGSFLVPTLAGLAVADAVARAFDVPDVAAAAWAP